MALCISSILGRGALALSRTTHWTSIRNLRAPAIPFVRAASSSRKSRTRLSAASSKGKAGKRSGRGGDTDQGDDGDADALESGVAPASLPFADAYHTPVMLKECVDALVWDPNGVYVDGTLGGGGHSLAICERLDELAAPNAPSNVVDSPPSPVLDGLKGTGKCLSLDRDPEALATASRRLATHLASGRWACAAADFRTLETVLRNSRSPESSSSDSGRSGSGGALGHLVPSDGLGVHGLLLDLGVSSHQLDDRKRGFSFRDDGPLDMRMGQQAAPSPEALREWATGSSSDSSGEEVGRSEDSTISDVSSDLSGGESPGNNVDSSSSNSGSSLTAATIVNTWPVSALERVLRDYGEEPRAHKMALRLTEARPINGTAHLVDIVRSCLPPGPPKEKRKALTRVFQGLRIAVNDEMAALEAVLEAAAKVVRPGGERKFPFNNLLFLLCFLFFVFISIDRTVDSIKRAACLIFIAVMFSFCTDLPRD